MKLLYLNDYACSPDILEECRNGSYPEAHLWGIKEYVERQGISGLRWHLIKKSRRCKRLWHIIECLNIFLKNYKCDTVYSALPGYELFFLVAKKLRLKPYRIITIVHHPGSRLPMLSSYDKLIFISKITFKKYSYLDNAEYLYWGTDLGKNRARKNEPEYDFVSAGKTYRDYALMKKVFHNLDGVKYKIFGDKSSEINEISYGSLLDFYTKSRFICIPMTQVRPEGSTLIGLTSFSDAMSLGLPVLMSDNSLIGIDVENENLGKIYKVGDEIDFRKKLNELMHLTEKEYERMHYCCLKFSQIHSFDKFSNRINELLHGV